MLTWSKCTDSGSFGIGIGISIGMKYIMEIGLGFYFMSGLHSMCD